MKFLVDAQLPARLAHTLTDLGHDALHTSSLPAGNSTSDADVVRIADEDDRVVISKDRDFRDGHLLRGASRRLLVVATGNITNDELLSIFDRHFHAVVEAIEDVGLVELHRDRLVLPHDL